MSEPYRLPCGHTLCLRPCLLSHTRSTTVRCVHCREAFDVAELRPNFAILSQLNRLSWNQEQNQKEEQKQDCKQAYFQEHQYRLLLHTKLNVLSYHKAILNTRLEQLQELNSLGLKTEERTKDEIIDALDAAVLHLCQMADTALNTATLKVWKVNEVSHGNVDALVRWITRLSLKVRRIQDVYASPIGITNWQKAVARWKSLKQCSREAKRLEEAVKQLGPIPMTQMQVSDRFIKVIQQLSEFSLIIRDGMVPATLISTSYSIKNERSPGANVSTNNTVETLEAKIYVGGLRRTHTESQLRQYFKKYGAITDCCISRDFKTNVSRRCGYVTFLKEEYARKAIEDSPHIIKSDPVRVKIFKKKIKQKKEKTNLQKHEVASNDVEVGHQLVVDDLPPVPKLNDILSFYGKFGAVTHVRVDEEMHRAFVAFSTAESVQKAVAAAPPRFKSANLRVSLCDEHGWRYATS